MKATVTKKSRFAALLLALLLILGALPMTARAAGTMVLEVGQVEASVTDTEVKVPIRATTNPGYGAGIITVTWAKDKLALKNVTYSAAAPNNGSAPVTNSGSYRIAFGDHLKTTDYTGTGVFFTLTFGIPAGAVPGEVPIHISATDVQDGNVNPVTVYSTSGKVTLTAPLWSFDKAARSLTVLSSAVSAARPVVVASYTSQGKYLGSVFVSAPGKASSVVKGGAGRVAILWVDTSAGFTPLSAAEKITLP